jgi:hypothetical protein
MALLETILSLYYYPVSVYKLQIKRYAAARAASASSSAATCNYYYY